MNLNISKRNLIILLTFTLIFCIVYSVLFAFSMKKEMEDFIDDVKNETKQPAFTEPDDLTEPNESYTLFEYEKKIGVYQGGNSYPTETLDVYVVTLPKADQAMLEKGIYANSKDELISLIEDYTS